MSWSEKCFNYLLGLTFITGAVSVHVTRPHSLPTAVIWATSILLSSIGVITLFRSALISSGSKRDLIASLPSLVLGWGIIRLAPGDWPVSCQVVFVVGALLATISFLFLGQSFAVFPAIRQIRTRGPYRLVRHPVYLGEWIMILSACLADSTIVSYILFGVTTGAIVWRILIEERLLSSDPTYETYRRQVTRRMMPWIW